MKNNRPLEPTRDEVYEWALTKKSITQQTFDLLPRSERLALARECEASGWLTRRRSPHWSQTAEGQGL